VSNEDPPKYSAYDHLKKDVAKKTKTRKETRNSGGLSTQFIGFVVVVVLFGGLMLSGALTGPGPFGFGNRNNNNNNNVQTGEENPEELTSICVQHTGLAAHYHFDVTLYIDGIQQTVPANVGIPNSNCYRPLHTHDGTGRVHVELPSDYSGNNPTLGDFFSVWGETFSETSLLGQSGATSVTINSANLDGNPRLIVPSDGDQISIRLTR
jgi:hypothetical protein